MSVAHSERQGSGEAGRAASSAFDDRLQGDLSALDDFARELSQLKAMLGDEEAAGGRSATGLPNRINADPERVEQGLAQLVLTVIELLRQLMERQAIRRIEAGSLSEDEIERLGETFLKFDKKMTELKEIFGLRDEDLNLNLGPLGNLM